MYAVQVRSVLRQRPWRVIAEANVLTHARELRKAFREEYDGLHDLIITGPGPSDRKHPKHPNQLGACLRGDAPAQSRLRRRV